MPSNSASQPRRCVVPALPDEDRLRVLRLHRLAEAPPEVMRDFVRDVQPPAVHAAFPHPMERHADEKRLHFFVVRVPLGHIAAGGKTLVVALFGVGLIAADQKPIVIPRRPPLLQHVPELRAQHTAMVEHGVQHDLHAPLVRFPDKFFEIFVRTEHLVDMEVVDGVVLMVARRSEHGR